MHVHQMQGAAFINLVYCTANKDEEFKYIKIRLAAPIIKHFDNKALAGITSIMAYATRRR